MPSKLLRNLATVCSEGKVIVNQIGNGNGNDKLERIKHITKSHKACYILTAK